MIKTIAKRHTHCTLTYRFNSPARTTKQTRALQKTLAPVARLWATQGSNSPKTD